MIRLSTLLATLICAAVFASTANADVSLYETEPNNTPANAHRISGGLTILGSMPPGDQDGFLWTVSDVDALKKWTFELDGVAGALTVVQIFRLDYAENGVDVVTQRALTKFGSRDGLSPLVVADLLFEPGEYMIGLASAGGASGDAGESIFRPSASSLSFGASGTPETALTDLSAPETPNDELGGDPRGYRLTIREGSALLVRGGSDAGPTREDATTIRAGQASASFQTQGSAWFSLEFRPEDLTQRWDVNIQAPVGRLVDAILYDQAGERLISGRTNDRGQVEFPDLSGRAEPYMIELRPIEPGYLLAFGSQAVGLRVEGQEIEPNDTWALANRFAPPRSVIGRSGKANDPDQFDFTLSDETSDTLLRASVTTADPGQQARICLLDASGGRIQCRDGTTPLQLPDLTLQPGRWGLFVRLAQADVGYELALAAVAPIEPGTEAEPNDTFGLATSVPTANRISGTFSGADEDFYRFVVTGEPQLWRFQAIGDGLTQLAYYDASGSRAQTVKSNGAGRARLENLFLLPGEHRVRVLGAAGGKYTLLARPLGPPDPNGEREPNDNVAGMQRLAMGQTRTGLLSESSDTDTYRFFLANWDHIQLTVQPPADGGIQAKLYWQNAGLTAARSAAPGEALELTGLFPPGDYRIEMIPAGVSEAEYKLSVSRLPRYGCAVDCEPNGLDQLYLSAPMPKDGLVEGKTGDWGGADTYLLPVQTSAAELVVRSPASVPLSLGRNKFDSKRLTYNSEQGTFRADLLPDVPYQLIVDKSAGNYSFSVEIDGLVDPPKADLPVTMMLKLDTTEVSAFRSFGQRVTGALTVANASANPIAFSVDATTSDYRWQVILERDEMTLAAGQSDSVLVDVRVPADAWADRPVRISARIRNEGGTQKETWQEIDIRPDLASVSPVLDWPMEDRLVGGFNVAWSGLGSTFVGSSFTGTGNYEYLFDDKVYGPNMACCPAAYGWKDEALPELTIELPGSAPVPIVGIALNHFVGAGNPWSNVREGALLLSDDGSSFREVLRFETLPMDTEQYFVLGTPEMARFARLRIDSTFGTRPGNFALALGEWKVIAEPGFDISSGSGFNIADPAVGGHVVRDAPPHPNRLTGIIDPAISNNGLNYLAAGQKLEYVVGFQHNRMAQINRIVWNYGDVSAAQRFVSVSVSVSSESPLGPWIHVGDLVTGDPNTASVLNIETPIWARFVRFSTERPEDASVLFEPLAIEIWEPPTSDDYRSILAEWGNSNRSSHYELRSGLPPQARETTGQNWTRDTAANLKPDEIATGQVALGMQERWYRLKMPANSNVLTFALTGDPSVRAALHLETEDGTAILLRRIEQESTPVRHLLEAIVPENETVFIRVTEPPRNVMFTWDTSASVNSYLPSIYNSLTAFASGVTPGQEAVNLLPFSETAPLLRDWYGEPYILQTILNDYPRVRSSSSGETALRTAADRLAPRAGSKAILVITDGRVVHDGAMWASMQNAVPRIFGVHIGGIEPYNQDLFQDWASINGGNYQYLVYDGEMEIAFDRAATLMRRPADFTLTANTDYREAPGPGLLSVLSRDPDAAETAQTSGTTFELILDASGSMLQRLNGKRRINIAKEVLSDAVTRLIPAGTPVALRVFGQKEPNACRTDLEIPLGPLDPAAAAEVIDGIQAKNLARTPIADSLAAVANDIGNTSGRVVVVLITDGEETCEGNPTLAIEALKARGIEVSLNIVGFAIDDVELSKQFADWAELGGGRYFAASGQADLSEAIGSALRIPFSVRDAAGLVVAEGLLDGEPISLPQGSYSVHVTGTVPATFDDVIIVGEAETKLRVQ